MSPAEIMRMAASIDAEKIAKAAKVAEPFIAARRAENAALKEEIAALKAKLAAKAAKRAKS